MKAYVPYFCLFTKIVIIRAAVCLRGQNQHSALSHASMDSSDEIAPSRCVGEEERKRNQDERCSGHEQTTPNSVNSSDEIASRFVGEEERKRNLDEHSSTHEHKAPKRVRATEGDETLEFRYELER